MKKDCGELVDLYSLDLLDARERERFEAHLVSCASCQKTIVANRAALSALASVTPPPALARDWVLDLARAPRTPVDLAQACSWEEVAPGVRLHIFSDDRPRTVRSQLMWAAPGAGRPAHRHLGEEAILVLQGGLLVGESTYQPGDICHVRAGALHVEQGAHSGECVCFLVHHPPYAGAVAFQGAPDDRCQRCQFFSPHSSVPPFVTPLRVPGERHI